MEKNWLQISSASLCIIAMLLATACSSSTDSSPDISEVKYEITKTGDLLLKRKYKRYSNGGETIVENPEYKNYGFNQWESNVYTVKHGTEMFIKVSAIVPPETDGGFHVAIYIDGVVENEYETEGFNSLDEPLSLDTITLSKVIGE